MLGLVVFTILIALIFDFTNGFHDAANSIATVVSTRVLSPMQAVIWAAFFNFVAAFGFGVGVATTIGKGVVRPEAINEYVILAGLIGAIVYRRHLLGRGDQRPLGGAVGGGQTDRLGLNPHHSPLCCLLFPDQVLSTAIVLPAKIADRVFDMGNKACHGVDRMPLTWR